MLVHICFLSLRGGRLTGRLLVYPPTELAGTYKGGTAPAAVPPTVIYHTGMVFSSLLSMVLSTPSCLAWRYWKYLIATCGNRA